MPYKKCEYCNTRYLIGREKLHLNKCLRYRKFRQMQANKPIIITEIAEPEQLEDLQPIEMEIPLEESETIENEDEMKKTKVAKIKHVESKEKKEESKHKLPKTKTGKKK